MGDVDILLDSLEAVRYDIAGRHSLANERTDSLNSFIVILGQK